MPHPHPRERRHAVGGSLIFAAAALVLLLVCEGAATPAQTTGANKSAAASNQTRRRSTRRRARRRPARARAAEPPRPLAVTIIGTADKEPSPDAQPPPPGEPAGAKFGERPKPNVVTGGVLNGKAVSKPQPPYPPIAKAARASGTVTVQILVDEEGKVISATAVSGHPLLQQAAVQAARGARFEPTYLAGQPVRVSGVITYNFVLQ